MAKTGPFGKAFALLYGLVWRDPKSNRILVDSFHLSPQDRILEIGCGPGAALQRAAAIVSEASAVDPTETLARQAAARVPAARVEVAGAEALPFADDSFTVAWSISAFHHWSDPDAGITEAFRVLSPGGVVHIAKKDTRRPGLHGLAPSEADEVAAKLVGAGFREPAITHHRAGRQRFVVVSAVV